MSAHSALVEAVAKRARDARPELVHRVGSSSLVHQVWLDLVGSYLSVPNSIADSFPTCDRLANSKSAVLFPNFQFTDSLDQVF